VQIAIAHDYLTQRGGAERVVLMLSRMFPDAPIYTSLYDPDGTYPEFAELDIRTSHLNRVPFFRKHHRAALPLLPFAISSMKIDAELVIVSSSGWAHGMRTRGIKLAYTYAPARWLYEGDRYLGDSTRWIRLGLNILRPALIWWDRRAHRTVDKHIAISSLTRDKLKSQYGVEAPILGAPHRYGLDDSRKISEHNPAGPRGYFLTVSRLLPYKNVDVIVDAFRYLTNERLVIVGSGPESERLKETAPDNVKFLENLLDSEVSACYSGAKALIAASYEDFGLTPLEAAVFGVPSIVLREGGFLDTVSTRSGLFFDEPTSDSVRTAVERFDAMQFDPEEIESLASRFTADAFSARLMAIIHETTRGGNSI